MRTKTGIARCCCPVCLIYTNDFTNPSTLSDFDVRAGTYNIITGGLRTTNPNGLVVCNTPLPTGFNKFHVFGIFKMGGDGDAGCLVFGYEDDNNYWYAEIQTGFTFDPLGEGGPGTGEEPVPAARLSFERVINGVTSKVADSTLIHNGTSSSFYKIEICYHGQRFEVNGRITSDAAGTTDSTQCFQIQEDIADLTFEETKFGVGSGVSSSNVRCEKFYFEHSHLDGFIGCRACVCAAGIGNCLRCTNNGNQQTRKQMRIKLKKFDNDGEPGPLQVNCPQFHGTYIFDYIGMGFNPAIPSQKSDCYWEYFPESTIVCPHPTPGQPTLLTRYMLLRLSNELPHRWILYFYDTTDVEITYGGPLSDENAWGALASIPILNPECLNNSDIQAQAPPGGPYSLLGSIFSHGFEGLETELAELSIVDGVDDDE